MPMMTPTPVEDKRFEPQEGCLEELQTFVRSAVGAGAPVHEVERGLWRRLLQLGQNRIIRRETSQPSGPVTPGMIAMSHANAAAPVTCYEELLALPDTLVGEIIAERLYVQPRPSGRHAVAERGLGIELGGPFDKGRGGPGGWWILLEPEVHLIRDTEVVVSDLAGWRRDRMPVVPEDHRFEIVPDWVCEILSPLTLQKDRIIKLPLYARYGIKHVWLVDPLARTLEAFELRAGAWMLIAALKEDDAVCVAPFAAVQFSLAELWI